MIKSARVTVGVTPVKVSVSETIDSLVGQVVAIKNIDGAQAVYLGGADVDIYNGWPLYAGEQVSVELEVPQDLYAVASADADIAVLWLDLQ